MASETDDIEELKRRLHECEQRERLYSLVFEHAPLPTVVVDDLGRVVVENRAAHEFFQAEIALRDLVTRPQGGWALRRIELAPFREELLGTGRATVELCLRSESGAVRHVAVEAKTHAPDRHILVLRDVTELRESAAELRHSRRVDSLGYLTAGVVHDLNNLLTPMLAISGLLVRELDPESRAGQLALDLRSVGDRTTELLKRVLAVVRNDAPATAPIDVNAVITDMRPLLATLLGDRIELTLALDPKIGAVWVQKDEIEQALLNLGANARDAMPDGGAVTIQTLDVDPGAAANSVDGDVRSAHVALVVTDTGVGMSPETQARMFDGGFTTKAPGRGTGLGLSTLQRFVERSGSLITVRSDLGGGTSIALYLRRDSPSHRSRTQVSALGIGDSIPRRRRARSTWRGFRCAL